MTTTVATVKIAEAGIVEDGMTGEGVCAISVAVAYNKGAV